MSLDYLHLDETHRTHSSGPVDHPEDPDVLNRTYWWSRMANFTVQFVQILLHVLDENARFLPPHLDSSNS